MWKERLYGVAVIAVGWFVLWVFSNLEPPMRAGQRDRQITIEQPAETRGDGGEVLTGWAPVLPAPRWAKVIPGGGAETFSVDQRTAEQKMRFEIMYQAGIKPTMRVQFDGEYYEIEDVTEVGRRKTIVLTCHALEVESGNEE